MRVAEFLLALSFLVATASSAPLKPFSNPCQFGFTFNGTGCEECGVRNGIPSVRIVGGVEAKAHDWYSTVFIKQTIRLRHNGRTEPITTVCGGTLINRNLVLTAAHCINDEETFPNQTEPTKFVPDNLNPTLASTITVFAGVHNIEFHWTNINQEPPAPGVKLKVAEIIIHPMFNSDTGEYDIALLRLEKAVELNSFIGLACLPKEYSTTFPQPDTLAWINGWGDTSWKGVNSDDLLEAQIKVYNETFCYGVLPKLRKDWNSQICAGDLTGKKDACSGDSGGGLYTEHEINGVKKRVVSGVVSYGKDCGRPNMPGIYSRVSYFLDWIYESQHFDTTDIIEILLISNATETIKEEGDSSTDSLKTTTILSTITASESTTTAEPSKTTNLIPTTSASTTTAAILTSTIPTTTTTTTSKTTTITTTTTPTTTSTTTTTTSTTTTTTTTSTTTTTTTTSTTTTTTTTPTTTTIPSTTTTTTIPTTTTTPPDLIDLIHVTISNLNYITNQIKNIFKRLFG